MVRKTTYTTFLLTFFLASFNHSVGWILPKQDHNQCRLTRGNKNSALFLKPFKSKNFIPTEQIEELRESVDIVSVIESYNLPQFKRNGGSRATCLCPFHDDHNPSMSIDGERGIYKCFSCGAGGNVYNFIREYSKLDGEEVTFPQAVQMIKDNFAPPGVGPSLDFKINHSRDSEFDHVEQAKKERIIQVNLAAAAYFEKNLVSMAGAGKARAYLRERKLDPTTVRAFSIGFAPDCYFHRKGDRSRRWGEGSLVNYLREQNFTAQEIFEAGLATKTNAKGKMKPNRPPAKEQEGINYTNIMDRFRGRIMVPIFDSAGKSVIGFGGRILDTMESKVATKTPKYLNSPESLIFKKQEVLFGQHMAQKSVRFWANKADDAKHPVVIVEGYMDVISLWQVGIREAVASMGTSLTTKQLNAVAEIAGRKNGHVVLCLDNDDAGLSAIERLCSGRVLHDLTERYPMEIRVASLPIGVKDPAEFIEHSASEDNVVEAFRTEIIAGAIEWSDWYIKRVLESYNPISSRGTNGSFGDLFERVAAFLANYRNPADRTKQSCEVAAQLGSIIAESDNKTQVSNAVLVQLETDLVERAASIAHSKISIASRQRLSTAGKTALETQLLDVSKEYDNLGLDERSKLSSRALRQIGETKEGIPNELGAGSIHKTGDEKRKLPRGSRFKLQRSPNGAPDFTPHFKGFEFLDENDEKWLGLADERGRKKNHYLLPKGTFNKFGEINEFGQKKPIYFNSNDYHGNQFLTTEAILAGYKPENVRRDPEIFRKGIASLLARDPSKECLDAEDSLLHMLVLYAPARKAVKTILDIGRASQSIENVPVHWSSNARRWLFHVLVEDERRIPVHINDPSDKQELYKYLEQCIASSAVPPASDSALFEEEVRIQAAKAPQDKSIELRNQVNADTSILRSNHSLPSEIAIHDAVPKIEEINFILDSKFDPPADFSTISIENEEMLQLSAQQRYSSLLLASARRRLSLLQDSLTTSLNLSNQTANETIIPNEDMQLLSPEVRSACDIEESIQVVNGTLKGNETQELFEMLATKIGETTQAISRIAESNSRLSQRLTDVALSRQIEEGEISRSDYEKLKQMLDENMLEISQFSVREDEYEVSEAYEDVLERAQNNWGKLYDDEYMWSPDDAREACRIMKNEDTDMYSNEAPMESSEPEDQESLEEFSARMEKSWGWLDRKHDSEIDVLENGSKSTFQQGKWNDLLPNDESWPSEA